MRFLPLPFNSFPPPPRILEIFKLFRCWAGRARYTLPVIPLTYFLRRCSHRAAPNFLRLIDTAKKRSLSHPPGDSSLYAREPRRERRDCATRRGGHCVTGIGNWLFCGISTITNTKTRASNARPYGITCTSDDDCIFNDFFRSASPCGCNLLNCHCSWRNAGHGE